jgi:hypothetical protein
MSNRTIRGVALCVAQLTLASQVHSAPLELPREGWTSWQVAAVEGAPDWCCWSGWGDDAASRLACRLDDHRGNVGNRDRSTTEAIRVYARVAGGRVERLRVFSASCPVEAKTPIHELGSVDTDDSARLLVELSKRGLDEASHEHGENLLAALAMHSGDIAGDALAAIARTDGRVESRKKAVFWLALLRGNAGADITTSVMFNDQDAEVRKHAAFAITQSRSPRIASELIRLGNTDKVGDVRAQAWFWLAHTGAAQAEDAIAAALRKDGDAHVREHAIFALSQLPDERATRALIAAAEDQSLAREQRKRAVFWLSQSESAGAQAYLERVLAPPIGMRQEAAASSN